MGISASLHAETKAEIVEWLRVDAEGLIEATSRPVPLQVSAFDVDSIKTREADSSLKEAEKSAHGLQAEIASWSKDPAVRAVAYTNTIEEYGTPLALALRLVLEEPGIDLDGPEAKNSQVLFFARTRDHAEDLAALVQPIIKGHMLERDRLLKSGGGPYDGLFSSRYTAEEIEKQTQAYLRLPNTTMKQKVMASLRTGVGFHNARLEPAMRELMEDGFRAGFIRLLFATETLKLGINLPADAVIIGSMVTPEGDGQRLMSIDSGIQKMGRAGRLGYGSKGESFLFVPNKFRDDVKIDDKTLRGLALEVGAAHASERARAIAAAGDLDAVYRYYLSTGRWLEQGAHYTSHLAQAEFWVAEHLLQDKFTRNKSYSKDEYVERIQELYKGTLDFRFTRALPDAERVLTSLIDAELIGDTQDDPGKYRLTGLGRAVSVNGVPTADAALIKEMAVALEEGAGSLTMLWLATTSSFVRDANSWIQVRRWDLAEQVQRDLNAQAKAVAREVSKLKDLTLRAGEAVDDVIGEGRAADELRALLMGNGDPLSRYNTEDPHTDLLRAALLVPWAQGVSFHRIDEGIANDRLTVHYVQSGERTRRRFPLHEADLRALAENVAYLLSAATDLLTIRPSGTAYRRLQNLAQAVEVGLPSGLHELARLNLPGTHRERLVPLVDHLDEYVDDPLDLVEKYLVDHDPLTDPSFQDRDRRAARFISRSDLRELTEELTKARERAVETGHMLSTPARTAKTPRGVTYGSVLEDMLLYMPRSRNAQAAQLVVEQMESLGLVAERREHEFTLTSRVNASSSLRFSVETEVVGFDRLATATGRVDVIICLSGMTIGARTLAPFGDETPTVIDPSTFLELVYGIEKIVGGDSSIEGMGEGAAYVNVGHLILELLRNNQPFMTGSDVHSRLLGLFVGEPPSLSLGPFKTASMRGVV